MNLLDENFPDDQRDILVRWRLPHRRIGHEVAWFGAQDSDLLTLLHGLRGSTLFTLDEDFFKIRYRHRAYGLAWLDVPSGDAAETVRRFLRHPRFGTQRRRMGIVARLRRDGLAFWAVGQSRLERMAW